MFENLDLKTHLEKSSSLNIGAAIIAEWNMNTPENISKIGNYRYRTRETSPTLDNFGIIQNTFDELDTAVAYTDATTADVVINGGLEDDDETPLTFVSKKVREKLLYSLEDCFGKFRPRSGINKLRYFDNKYSHFSNIDMGARPRYYMGHKDDSFKYWTSYRTETGIERGISSPLLGEYPIDDAAPFVVYKNTVPTNRITIKVQTNVGNVDLGPFTNSTESYPDPFYGLSNQTTPSTWKVQTLHNNAWVDAVSFLDTDESFGSDGFLELAYGLVLTEQYRSIFKYLGEYQVPAQLPAIAEVGDAYLVRNVLTSIGEYYIYTGAGYQSFVPVYGWSKYSQTLSSDIGMVTELVNTPQYLDPITQAESFREFQYISGLRLVVDTMASADASLDLIELSPRLAVNVSDLVTNYGITKMSSDLGTSGMPVGQLLAATGNLSMFDNENAFNSNNSNSIIANYLVSKNIQFKFYEIIKDVPTYENDVIVARPNFYIPIKTMYVDKFPEVDKETRAVSVTLRDFFFYFESETAPQILASNVSLSYALSLLFDAVGFSNYTFKKIPGEVEPIIPYFFIAPDRSVAEVLQDLALSTQTAMFFDEYNNFVLMNKEYMLPNSADERATAMVLRGTKDYSRSSSKVGGTDTVLKNKNIAVNGELSNIISVSSTDSNIYNDGIIAYNSRYIQKTYGSIRQASLIDQDKTWIYKPVLLWEVSGSEVTKTQNDESSTQSAYSLSAMPLNSTLSNTIPFVAVVDGTLQITNNTMNFGEGIYWISRYNGYFFANGEIIKYDAVQFNIAGIGDVWITDTQEYSYYFSKLPFNGKIYPTGLVRIFSEPNYRVFEDTTVLKLGDVAKHGRAQFGTEITQHEAGVNNYWTNKNPDTAPVRGVKMESKYLFGKSDDFTISGIYTDTANKGDFNFKEVDLTSLSISTTQYSSTIQASFDHLLSIGDAFYITENVAPFVAGTVYTVKEILSNSTFSVQNPENLLPIIADETASDVVMRLVNANINIGSNVIASTDHGFENGDLVSFDSYTSLPTEISKGKVYYVIESTANSFKVSETPNGTEINFTDSPEPTKYTVNQKVLTNIDTVIVNFVSGTVSIPNHRFEVGDPIYFVTTGTLPAGISANSVYYVSDVSSLDELSFSSSRGGANVSFTGAGAGVHSLCQIILNNVKSEILGINFDSNPQAIEKPGHGFVVDDVISFSTNGKLPTGIDVSKSYKVKTVVSTSEFSICNLDNSVVRVSGTVNDKNFVTKNANINVPSATYTTTTAGQAIKFTQTMGSLQVNDKVFLTTPSGSTLPQGILANKIYYVSYANNSSGIFQLSETRNGGSIVRPTPGTDGTGTYGLFMVSDPLVVSTVKNHRLESGNRIYFESPTYLPYGIGSQSKYYVKETLNNKNFLISSRLGGSHHSSSEPLVGTFSLLLDVSSSVEDVNNGAVTSDFLNSRIVVPDISRVQINYIVEIFQGTGNTGSGNTRVLSTIDNTIGEDVITITQPLIAPILDGYIDPETQDYVTNSIRIFDKAPSSPSSTIGKAGVSSNNNKLALAASRTGVLKNFMTSSTVTETDANAMLSTQSGTIQSSALIFTGPASGSFPTGDDNAEAVNPIDFLSYVYKPLASDVEGVASKKFSHFGTRMRIIGRIDGTQDRQTPVGSSVYYDVSQAISTDNAITVSGGSGGISVLLNPETNNGYHFEIIALTQNNTSSYFENEQLDNVVFYKTTKKNTKTIVPISITVSANVATVTSQDPHELVNGDVVTIKNFGYGLDGSFVITSSTSDAAVFSYNVSATNGTYNSNSIATAYVQENAIPTKLWGGTTSILTDDGSFTGQARMFAEENPSVYDLAVEYQDLNGSRRFFLYINGKIVATVDDHDPLPEYNNMAVFVRGSSRCMFENVYAVGGNYSENTSQLLETPGISSVFGDSEISLNDSFRKYAMSGLVQSTYLSGINPSSPPKYNMYFEEFGTIMREASYFKIRYDKAYPALYAKLSPTFNGLKGYTVSGFMAGSYGAEFLIFNNTDSVLNLDDTTGNYLRIQGVTFTQQSSHEYSVDEYFSQVGDFSNIEIGQGTGVSSYDKNKKEYQDIKNSRMLHGKQQFSLNAPYIQDRDTAQGMMSWMISKILKPRKSVGLSVFGIPTLQLGDIIEIDYKTNDGSIDQVAVEGSRFVVYNIDYQRDGSGPNMTVYVSEVG